MTSLDPSHNPLSHKAQAVYDPAHSSPFPDNLPQPSRHGHDKAKREGKRRVTRQMPPLPDLRFEQSYLLSIRPFLKPSPRTESGREDKKSEKPSGAAVAQSTDRDEVFHWGREVDVDWQKVAWVTIRDQLFAPLIQGAVWGWASILLAATGVALRASLYPASHVRQGRVAGGPGGSIKSAGGGDAVAGGWWKNWVGSFFGGAETNAVI
ncbi:hypothetical protein B9479_002695 [Cryptococcus floricola]|uniref:Uncharacterized protein n=1 Tax=Cryptococcus floricola TaxID=2591691 RepID=A0A5D3B330_9TREE|nr:hypothetical protein B9479_002695 [Cryptococcus floricola]